MGITIQDAQDSAVDLDHKDILGSEAHGHFVCLSCVRGLLGFHARIRLASVRRLLVKRRGL